MAFTADAIIANIESRLGESGTHVWDYYKLARGTPWCSGEICYTFAHTGSRKKIFGGSPVFYVPTAQVWLAKHYDTVYDYRRGGDLSRVRKGDIVVFMWTRGSRDHIGFARADGDPAVLYTIEGNTSGGKLDTRTREKRYIHSVYRPPWSKTTPEYKPPKGSYAGSYPDIPKRGYFKSGDKGTNVKFLQELLNWLLTGSYGYSLKVDGEVGPKTIRSVKLFQEIHHILSDGEFGNTSLRTARNTKLTGALKAVNWAVSISKDNSFAYGEGERAHHCGCYFCGTNVTGPKKAKKGSRWEKTYCCNPFIFAAYAHGAKDSKILAACKKGAGGGMNTKDWTKYGCFKTVGKSSAVSFDKLEPGDVIVINHGEHHVWMYTGKDGIVEASGGTFNADSIAHKNGAKKRYTSYQKNSTSYVLRYVR